MKKKVIDAKDLIGKKFGRLLVVGLGKDYIEPNGRVKPRVHCVCDCGNECDVLVSELLRKPDGKHNPTKSCGCLRREVAKTLPQNFKHETNEYDLSKEYGIGLTHNTNKEFYFDLEDYDKIKDCCWYEATDDTGYHYLAATDIETKKQVRFTQVLDCKNYDHINRNPLDNRRKNLRKCEYYQNMQNQGVQKNNKSGITGVRWDIQKNKWVAQITANKEKMYLGAFINKNDAIKTRLEAEAKYFKEFAPQQHLFEQYGIIIKQNKGVTNEQEL